VLPVELAAGINEAWDFQAIFCNANDHRESVMLRVLVLVIGLLSVSAVEAQQLLDTITVSGTSVEIPWGGGGGGGAGGGFQGHFRNSTTLSSCSGPDAGCVLDLTVAQVCSILKSQQPPNCSVTTYPPAPGIPSASGATFSGNGCGAGIWSSVFATIGLYAKYGSRFSGDLNEPVAGNPSIDFTHTCMAHDSCYSGFFPGKAGCDNQFMNSLYHTLCDHSTDSSSCYDFAMDYVNAVAYHGDDAYAQDQAARACTVWGASMKFDKCSP